MAEKREQRAFISNVELRAADDGQQPKLAGYFVEWEQLSDPIWGMFREKFARGAFQSSSNKDVRALWNHETNMPLGRTTNSTLTLMEDQRGMGFEITLDPEISWHKDAQRSIQRGDVTSMSFMFVSTVDEWDETNPQMAIRTVKQADLYEISPVTFPAYPSTSVNLRSAEDVFKSYSEQKRSVEDKPEELKNVDILRKKLELISKL